LACPVIQYGARTCFVIARMHLLITGANGFIGRALVAHLLADATCPFTRLTLLDLHLPPCADQRVRAIAGDIGDPTVIAQAFAEPADTIIHLASIPGGMAERDPALGWKVNVEASARLIEHAGTQDNLPVFVFASSIAVFGTMPQEGVDDSTPLRPLMSYGAHKQIGEIMLCDATRRGQVDGRAVRVPGIVMRPPARTGQLSAFMSEIIRETAAGRRYQCPVSAGARLWLMSLECIVDNLLHAARMPAPGPDCARAWTLPALHLSMAGLVEAVGHCGGHDTSALVEYRPDPKLEQTFGSHPPLRAAQADALGFRHDGDVKTLVQRALAADKFNAANPADTIRNPR